MAGYVCLELSQDDGDACLGGQVCEDLQFEQLDVGRITRSHKEALQERLKHAL
jgi:hypothetical protein